MQGRGSQFIFPFFGNQELGLGTVTLYGNEEARTATFLPLSRVQQGTDRWNNGCTVKKGLPTFQVNWTQNRPPITNEPENQTYRNSMLIEYRPNEAAPFDDEHGGYAAAVWKGDQNRIIVYGKCPSDGTHGFECFPNAPGGTIRWDSDWGAFVIAHEVGHALGLADDANSGCSHGVMKSPATPADSGLGVSQYCRYVNAANNSQSPCNSEAAESGEGHPCENARLFGRPGGFGRFGHSFDICAESPWSCSLGGLPPWGGGASCNYACVTVTTQDGDSSTACDWGCTWAVLADPSKAAVAVGEAPSGMAPFLLVDQPQPNQTVSGILDVAGWATDLTGASGVTFGVDGHEIQLASYATQIFDARACQLPHGVEHGACNPNAGFSGRFDTSALANGAHELVVVATDPVGWPTEVSVPFTVDNGPCGDAVPPTVQLSAPAAGATVTGTVNVAASASDNRGVVRVEFFVDDQYVGQDATSPYAFSWNTAGVSGGSHTLRAKAYDACGNVASSPLRTVQVLGAPAAPSGLAATYDTNARRYTLTWADNSNNEQGFTIQFSYAGSAFSDLANVGANGTTYTSAINPPTGTYQFRVRAYDATMTSAWSNVASLLVANPTNGPGYLGCYTDSATRALPAQLGGTTHTVESCKQAAYNAGYRYAGLQYYGYCFGGNTLGYTLVPNAECNLPCTTNPTQVCGGSWRNSIYDTGFVPAPVAPSGVAASYNSVAKTITVSWADNSADEQGFNVQVSYSGSAFSDMANVGANVTSHTSGPNPPLGSYQFRVRAYNTSGASAWSNVASLIAGAPPTTSIAWIHPAESTWGPAGTLTAAGYAANGTGGVQLVWRERSSTGVWGPWTTVAWQPPPQPDTTWSNTISSGNPTDQCHWFDAYTNYSGVTSAVFHYTGAPGCP